MACPDLTQALSRVTARRTEGWGTEALVERLNRMLTGWGRYYCLGPVTPAYRAVDAHVRHRLRRWLRKKHKCGGRATGRYPDEFLDDTLGTGALDTDDPWPAVGEGMRSQREPGAGEPHARFDERGLET